MNSTYTGSWTFSATVIYEAFTTGFVDMTPTAVAGGPYLGVTSVPVTFDGSGSQVGASGASFAITRYEWDFNNDGVFDLQSAVPTAQHTYQSPYSGDVALRVTRSDATNHTATASVLITSRFDLDQDGDVDNADLAIVLGDRGKTTAASTCGVACDFDADGFITAVDGRLLVAQCTRPNCAIQ
jgi:PKD repeat protein